MGTKDGRHNFKWLSFKGNKVRIYRDIAPLLSNMWKLGINTIGCCQSHCTYSCKHKVKVIKYKDGSSYWKPTKTIKCNQFIWIAFDSAHDLEKFYNYVAVYENTDFGSGHTNSMYDCIQGFSQKKYPDDTWEISPCIRNRGVSFHWGWEKTSQASLDAYPKTKRYEVAIEDGCKKNNFRMQPQLWFPRKHLVYVEERLQLALKIK